jgi:hypothetical protein
MAGVLSIMQVMLDEVAPKLKTGIRMLSETVRAGWVRKVESTALRWARACSARLSHFSSGSLTTAG